MYTGHVYHFDGTPLKGIKVTDGFNISVTDETGFYSLAGWARANVISVGALTLYHNDWFRYIDKEHSVYDFYITPVGDKTGASFAHVTDTEIFLDNASVDKWIDFARKAVDSEKCDFLIHTGDICRIRGLEAHYKELNYHTLGVPVRYTLGNHDYVDDKYGEYSYERLYGPIYYSFDFGGVHFIVLPIRKGETAGLYDPDDSVRWLKKDLTLLDKGKRIVVFSHSYCHESEEAFVYGQSETVDLKDYGILAWMFGHLHVSYCNKTECGAYNIATARPDQGGIDLSPAGIRIATIQGDELNTKIIYNKKSYTEDVTPFLYKKKLCREFLFTSPIYSDGRIYAVGSDDGYPKDVSLCALDAESGELVYKIPLSDGVKTEPIYSDGRLFILDTHGNLYSFNTECGEILWQTKLPDSHPCYHKGGMFVDDSVLYVHGSAALYGYSVKDGKLLLSSAVNTKPDFKSAKIIKSGENILFPTQWGRLSLLDSKGEELWSVPRIKDSLACPVLDNNVAYIPSGKTLFKLSLNTGEILAETQKYGDSAFDTPTKPLIGEEYIFVAMNDVGVIALDKSTLDIKKKYKTSEALVAVCPYLDHTTHTVAGDIRFYDEGVIYFASCDGNIYFYEVDTEQCIWKIKVGEAITSTPVIAGEKLYVLDISGNLYAYKLPKN